ncbi:Hypothetical predicted protein, partial [Mytilus galloprovincialis]
MHVLLLLTFLPMVLSNTICNNHCTCRHKGRGKNRIYVGTCDGSLKGELTYIPKFPNGTSKVVFINNGLQILSRESLGNISSMHSHITDLNLKYNKIKSIHNNAFSDMLWLCSLDISGNDQIKSSDLANSFNSLPKDDACSLINCKNGTCKVDPTTKQAYCECIVSPCDNPASMCIHGGNCTLLADGNITCSCPDGYSGGMCELSACSTGDIKCGPGTCYTKSGNVYCDCPPGFLGNRCQNDPCSGVDCSGNGQCQFNRTTGQAMCMCNGQFSGKSCEISPCDNKCLNNGTCQISDGNVSCSCRGGFSGDRCEQSPCTNHTNCGENGKCCVDENGLPKCYCNPGYFGTLCTKNVCDLVSCSNHGNCTTSGDCVCDKNWSGKDCSKEVNEDFCIGKASGHYAHPTDCTAYYVCHADTERTALLYCGPGTLWSQSLKVCADPAITKVECFEGVGNYSNGNTTQSVCSTIQNGHLPNPEDCSSFIQCANGVAHIMPCPLGLHWNPNILNCDFPENVEPRCSTLQGSQATENPCDIDTCNGNGICVVVNGAAVCNCFQGWLTDNCS